LLTPSLCPGDGPQGRLRGLLRDVAETRGGVILFVDELHMLSEWTAAPSPVVLPVHELRTLDG